MSTSLARFELLRIARSPKRGVYAIILLLHVTGVAAIYLVTWLTMAAPGPEYLAGRGLLVLSIFTALVMVILSPLLTLHLISRDPADGYSLALRLSPLRSPLILSGLLVGPVLFVALLVFISALPSVLLFLLYGFPPWAIIWSSHLLLVLMGVSFAIAGLLCELSFRNVYSALGLFSLLALLLLSSIFAIGPALAPFPEHSEAMIQTALLVNPVIGICSVIGLDIMRTETIYFLSEISRRRFDYPEFPSLILFYTLGPLALFALSSWRFNSWRRHNNRQPGE